MTHYRFKRALVVFFGVAACFPVSLSVYSSAHAAPLRDILETIAKDSVHGRKLRGIIYVEQNGKEVSFECSGPGKWSAETSRFVIASISKQFTAAVILRLRDQGRIDLDAPITKYLEGKTFAWRHKVTARHLLNHSSGISAEDKPLAFAPGTGFQYSPTLTYYLLSRIAEKVSGKPFDALLRELFSLTGMKRTSFAQTRSLKKLRKRTPALIPGLMEKGGRLVPASLLDEGVDEPGGTWTHPGGGIISTTKDLARWNRALHHGELLSKRSYKAMVRISNVRKGHRYGDLGYGFGIQVSKDDGIQERSHSGYVNGYVSTLLYYPKERTSVVILENVSWALSDIKRVFGMHDAVRDAVRKAIRTKAL